MTLELTTARPYDPQSPVAAVSAARMMADLQRLAQWTKVAATPSEAASLAFVRSRFADAGFKTEIIWHDAYISVPGDAHVMHGETRLTAITHSMGRSSPPTGLTGRVIDLGSGEEADFAGKNLAGRLVLVDGIAMPASARHGALPGRGAATERDRVRTPKCLSSQRRRGACIADARANRVGRCRSP